MEELERQKCKVVGKTTYQRLRVDGRLTDCLTGDRIVYIERPSFSLPRSMTFGIFKGRVYHQNQTVADPRNVTCSNCLSVGHHRSKCTSEVVCRRCKSSGHIASDCGNPTPPTSPDRSADTDAASDAANKTGHAAAAGTKYADTAERKSDVRRNTNTNLPNEPCEDKRVPSNRSQAKITQFIVGMRDQHECTQSESDTVNAGDERESQNNTSVGDDPSEDEDDVLVEDFSELSAESPDYFAKTKEEKERLKRKQKIRSKPAKKR